MATQLEEYTATFKGTEEEERRLLASLASLKAELKNSNNQVVNLKKEAEDSSAEMEEQLSRLQADLEAAIAGEARAKESVSRLHEEFQQVRYYLPKYFLICSFSQNESALYNQRSFWRLCHFSTMQKKSDWKTHVILKQVTTEASEARSAAAQSKQEADARKQELEQALAHTSTLESRLLAAIKETEAARASEAFAVAEV